MPSKSSTAPDVFIIESSKGSDEDRGAFEGRLLSDMLGLSGKYCEYVYIRTKRELAWAVERFAAVKLRYLHLSCHGNEKSMGTTLDSVPFADLGSTLKPVLENRRLFVSACSMMNSALAKAILPDSRCYSMIGPTEMILTGDAALTWASFFHLMFERNEKAMKSVDILDVVQTVANTFHVPLRYYTGKVQRGGGHLLRHIRPKSQTRNCGGDGEEEGLPRRVVVKVRKRR